MQLVIRSLKIVHEMSIWRNPMHLNKHSLYKLCLNFNVVSSTFATWNRVLNANTAVYCKGKKKSAQMTKSDRLVESIVLNWKAIGTNGARSLWRGAKPNTHSAIFGCMFLFLCVLLLFLHSLSTWAHWLSCKQRTHLLCSYVSIAVLWLR